MRTNLTAMLSFGVVSCPVGIATSAKRRDIEFRNLHKKCKKPVNEIKICRSEDCDSSQSLLEDDLLKGIQISKDQWVTFTHTEVERIKGGRSPVINIGKFVPADEIEQKIVERSYILVPKAVGQRSYEILSWVLLEKNVAGVGKARLWGKETPIAVVSDKGVLYVRMLYCMDEVQPDAEVYASMKLDLPSEEIELAEMLVDLMTSRLMPEDVMNDTRAEFDSQIEAKLTGKELEARTPDPEPDVSADTFAALRESVKRVQDARAAA